MTDLAYYRQCHKDNEQLRAELAGIRERIATARWMLPGMLGGMELNYVLSLLKTIEGKTT